MDTKNILTAMNAFGAGIDIDKFNRESKMKTFRAWGEYGPQAGNYIELPLFKAKDVVEARTYAITELKKLYEWSRIGERNVHIQETK